MAAFLEKVGKILEECDNGIATWTRNGRWQKLSKIETMICFGSFQGDTFIVKKPKFFADEILPKYFRHNNFRSFVR
jgi:hypothetical protein